ncbi:MAG: sugar phosphate nucleotidyltransferase [Patescibacteria group bacterium]|nr:NTP transferase domain-containing protein [Patescibacteria group bacterium]
MKGIILAGGTGSRLRPLTKVTNKHLLPVYNKPMIYYPIRTLKQAGINEILIVSGKGHAGGFLELLGSGSSLGVDLSFDVQENAGGIAEALSLAESFAAGESVCVVLGDNIIFDDISGAVKEYESQGGGAKIFLKSVPNPSSYGVAEISGDKIEKIIEKPENPPSDLAVIGCYLYDNRVFDVIKGLKPSGRNELEITDVNNFYIDQGSMTYNVLNGWWGDCGESFDSLKEASDLVAKSSLAGLDGFFDVGGSTRKVGGIKKDPLKRGVGV